MSFLLRLFRVNISSRSLGTTQSVCTESQTQKSHAGFKHFCNPARVFPVWTRIAIYLLGYHYVHRWFSKPEPPYTHRAMIAHTINFFTLCSVHFYFREFPPLIFLIFIFMEWTFSPFSPPLFFKWRSSLAYLTSPLSLSLHCVLCSGGGPATFSSLV